MRTLVRNKRFLGVIAFAVAAFLLAFPVTAKATPLPWTWDKASPDSWGVAGVWSGDMMTGFVADMQEYNGDLYVSGLSNNGPVLWRHNLSGDQSWEDVTPTDAIGGSWNLGKMTVGNDKLYITANDSGGSHVISYDGVLWADDENFEALDTEYIYGIAYHNGGLCVYAWKENTTMVYCYADGTWDDTNLAAAGVTQAATSSTPLVEANGKLYASGADENNNAGLWEYDGTWSRVATPFTDESNSGEEYPWLIGDMIKDSYGGLAVGVFNPGDNRVEIYAYINTTWTKLGTTYNFGQGDDGAFSEPHLAVYNDALVAGVGNYTNGTAVYEYTESGWVLRNDDYFGAPYNEDGYNPTYIRNLEVVNGQLFASSANTGEGDYFNQVWKTGETAPDPDVADDDGDGITNSVESAGPNNGDANNNSVDDSNESSVASFVNPVTGHYQVITTNCEGVTNLQTGAESADPADAGYDYPAGLTAFHATCEPGATAHFEQYFYGVNGNDTFVLRKWSNGVYETMNGVTFEGILLGDEVVFRASYDITDGGQYDEDGEENGTIVDPAGPATPAAASQNGSGSSNGSSSNGSLAGTGQSIWIILGAAIGISVVAGSLIIKSRR